MTWRKLKIEDIPYLIAWSTLFLPPVIPRMSNVTAHGFTLMGYVVVLILFVYSKKALPAGRDLLLALALVMYCIFIILLKTPGELPLFARRQILPLLEGVVLIKLSFSHNRRGFDILYRVSAFYIIANFVSMLLFPRGIFRSSIGSAVARAQWIFGSKNNIPLYMIIFTVIVAYHYYTVRRDRSFFTLLGMAFFCVVMSGERGVKLFGGSSTGIIAYAVTEGLILYYMYSEKMHKPPVRAKTLFIVILIINLIILTGQSLPGMNNFIINVLHKSLTFTGRTLIWDANVKAIRHHLFFGHGEKGIMAQVRIDKVWVTTDYTYNLMLKLLLNYGAVGAGLFVAMVLRIYRSHEVSDCILFVGLIGLMSIGLMNEVDLNMLMFFPNMLMVYRKPLPAAERRRVRRMQSLSEEGAEACAFGEIGERDESVGAGIEEGLDDGLEDVQPGFEEGLENDLDGIETGINGGFEGVELGLDDGFEGTERELDDGVDGTGSELEDGFERFESELRDDLEGMIFS